MFEINRILVIISPEEEIQPALARATTLALSTKAELELFIADFNSYLVDGRYFDPVVAQKLRREHGEQRMELLEKLADPLRKKGLKVSCATAWGNPPHEEIVRRARELQADLTIKTAQRQGKLTGLFLGHDDWELIRYCPTPLLLTRDSDWAAEPVIIAAIDPQHSHQKPDTLDDRIIAAARSFAGLMHGSVALYHATPLPPLPGLTHLESDLITDLKKLQQIAKTADLPASACHVTSETIIYSLPALIEKLHASLVVMGAVSRSGLDRILIGSTAEKVLNRLSCDVLVIKPEDLNDAKT